MLSKDTVTFPTRILKLRRRLSPYSPPMTKLVFIVKCRGKY